INGVASGTAAAGGSFSQTVTANAPGTLPLTVVASNAQGVVASTQLFLVATDAASLDQMLRGLWGIFTAALEARDKTQALSLFTLEAAAKYGPVLDALTERLPTIAASFSPLLSSRISHDTAEYVVIRPFEDNTRAYFIYFVRAE